jgi:hypothetical protein
MEPCKTVALKDGRTFEIVHDDCPMNPREDCDNLGTMVCFHRRYNLGDNDHGYRSEDYSGWDAMRAAIEKQEDVAAILPVYMFDHSGVSLSTGCEHFRACDSAGWDWGQVGFIFVSKAKAREWFGWTRITKSRLARIHECLVAEVDVYGKYVNGETYCYIIRKACCDECGGEGEVEECVGGFIGYDFDENGMLDNLPVEIREQVEAA